MMASHRCFGTHAKKASQIVDEIQEKNASYFMEESYE